MKSNIEVRVFAVNKAVEVMGAGAVIKDVVAKAQEIEKYVLGAAVLPEVADEVSLIDYLNKVASLLGGSADVAAPAVEPASEK